MKDLFWAACAASALFLVGLFWVLYTIIIIQGA